MCECRVCKRSRKVVDLASRLNKTDQDFLTELVGDLDHTEMERDYLKAVVGGNWPDADKVITNARKDT
jgi:hypothetical protein